MMFILVIVAVILGSLMPFQAAINAELSRVIRQPYFVAFLSFSTGALVLSILAFFQGDTLNVIRRLPTVPLHLFLGGALGALFVGSTIFLIPRMGATAMIASLVTGQLLMSIIMDHYGWFGLPVNPINSVRIVGVVILFFGISLVMKKAS